MNVSLESLHEGTPPQSLCAQLIIPICHYLQDGEWHSWDDLVKVVTPYVPRPVAGRQGKNDWERSYKKRNPGKSPPYRNPNSEALIQSGARTWIGWAVYGSNRWFEKVGKRGKVRIRMRAVPRHIRAYVYAEPARVPQEGPESTGGTSE